MSSSALDPELRSVARFLPRAAVNARSLPLIRCLEAIPAGSSANAPTVDHVSEGVTVRVHQPYGSADQLGALLWLHGGGYVIGTARQEDAHCRRLCDELGVVVAAVEYRRAPEHPHPVPLEDCYAALRWLAGMGRVDSGRIALGGVSAGAGLAAALALLTRDRGELSPIFQSLAYPMLDDRTVNRSDVDQSGFRLWNQTANRFGWRSYLNQEPGTDSVPNSAVPARAQDLTGLPSTWIGVGSQDLFHDESVRYAERLEAAGVSCELTVAPGAFHGFDLIRPNASVSRTFKADQRSALQRAFAGS
jgi:acetyl esterase/lipase